jgi:PAS domain S-box-containing protein
VGTEHAGGDPYAAAERVLADLLALLCGTTGSGSACVAETVDDGAPRVLSVHGPAFRSQGHQTPDPRLHEVARGREPVVSPLFLGLPLWKADRVVGVVGLADCPDGYDEALVADLAPLVETCASLVVSCHDVSRLHRAEVQRRLAAEARLDRDRRLLDDIVDNTTAVVFVKDRDGRYLLVNEQYEQIVGLGRDQVLGRRDTDLMATGPATAVMANDHEVLARGTPLQFEEVVPRDGEPRTYLSVKFPIRDADGEPYAVGGIATDITDRRRAEERGRMLAALVEQSADFVGVADLTGACLFVNDAGAALVGLDRPVEELTIRDFVHPTDWPRHEQEVMAALRDSGSWVGDAVFRHLGTGEPLPVDFRVFAIVDAQPGGDPLVGCVARDLRAQRRAEREREVLEAQLHQAQRLESVGRLAGGVAHDFNNLLTVIVAYAEMLLPELDEEGLREEVEQIRSAAERATALTRQLLLFSRRGVSDPRPVQPTRVLQRLEHLLRRTLGEDVALAMRYATDATVEIDPASLEQVVVNLAVNARDAMPAGGELTIHTRAGTSSGTVELVVSDTGEGMPPDVAAQAFEPFFTTKQPDRGTGLGLPTVHGIVEQAGGSIRLDSRVGEGTAVRVTLPVVPDRGGREEPGPVTPTTTPGAGETVLVVEDEATVRRLTERVLTGHGYRVVAASGPEEAIAAAGRADLTLDLVLTDMVMPGMTGTQVVEAVRRERPGLPVVLMSGYPRAVLGESLPPGTTLLGKPFSVAALLDVVRRTLERPGAP